MNLKELDEYVLILRNLYPDTCEVKVNNGVTSIIDRDQTGNKEEVAEVRINSGAVVVRLDKVSREKLAAMAKFVKTTTPSAKVVEIDDRFSKLEIE